MKIITNKEYYFLRSQVSMGKDMLNSLHYYIRSKESEKFKFVLSAIGSGNCVWQINEKDLLEYNQFFNEFNGFYLNGTKITIEKLISYLESK